MNLKLFTSAFVVILLVLSSVESNKKRQPTLIEVLETIVNDPEYLALSDNQQLEVLVMIYTLKQFIDYVHMVDCLNSTMPASKVTFKKYDLDKKRIVKKRLVEVRQTENGIPYEFFQVI